MSILAKGGPIPTVGVIIEAIKVDDVPVAERFPARTGVHYEIDYPLQWAMGAAPTLITIPPTYEVSSLINREWL